MKILELLIIPTNAEPICVVSNDFCNKNAFRLRNLIVHYINKLFYQGKLFLFLFTIFKRGRDFQRTQSISLHNTFKCFFAVNEDVNKTHKIFI